MTLSRKLELRVRRRTSELETANREMAAFIYSISHDLKAPLRAINGFSQIIETQPCGKSGAGRPKTFRLYSRCRRTDVPTY